MNLIKSTSAILLFAYNLSFFSYAQEYCVPNPSKGGAFGDIIDSISISNIFNASGYEDTNYVYYYDKKIELCRDTEYTLTIKSGTVPNNTYIAWIDYDHNGDFYGTDEKLGEFAAPTAGFESSINFKIPNSVTLGKTRMRIRAVWSIIDPDPCTDYTYGETEDYYINISSFGNIALQGIPQMAINVCSKFGDINNDGFPDYIVTGFTENPQQPHAEVYLNDGSNNYTPMLAGMQELLFSTFSLNDYNNDGWIDIFLSGTDGSNNYNYLYSNNKDGTFNEIEPDIPSLFCFSQEWGDYNLDGKEDLLISGEIKLTGDDLPITLLYINEGDGSFSKMEIDLPELEGVAKFTDLDNDNDLDITVSGFDKYDNRYTKIYYQRKDHNIVLFPSNIKGLNFNDFDWADYDNDNDLDLAISGKLFSNNLFYIYNNLADSSFKILDSHEGSKFPSVYWVDFDNDGILDIFLGGTYNSIIYGGADLSYNEQEFIFNEYVSDDMADYLSVPIIDINNDNSPDFYINGYFKEAEGNFGRNFILENRPEKSNNPPDVPTNLDISIVGLEIILSWEGSEDDNTPSSRISYNIYLKNITDNKEVILPLSDLATGKLKTPKRGNAGYNKQYVVKNIVPNKDYSFQVQAIDDNYASSAFSSAKNFNIPTRFITGPQIGAYKYARFCDIDTNGTLDIIKLNGYNPGKITKPSEKDSSSLIINKPLGTFSEYYSSLNITSGRVYLGDYNNDNKVDYQVLGYYDDYISDTETVFYPYRNPLINKSLMNGDGDFGDFDNDGDLDLAIVGNDSLGNYYTLLYKNNSAFIPIKHKIPSISYGTIKWVDYDNDMDLDLFISGRDSTGKYITDIYKNCDTVFIPINMEITKFINTLVDWGDYDNDGDLDIVLSGLDELNGNSFTRIYRNDSLDIFTLIKEIASSEPVNWGDYNNDGLLDLLADNDIHINLGNDIFEKLGLSSGSNADSWGDIDNDGDLDLLYSKMILNQSTSIVNTQPEAPTNLTYQNDMLDVIIYWDEAIDKESTKGGLYYNLKIGSEKDKIDIMSPSGNLKTGKLFYPHFGNAGTNKSWRLKGLNPGTYYWSVQAIDQSYEGGKWAPVDSFIVKDLGAEFKFDTVCMGNPTNFSDLSVTSDVLTAWKWSFDDGAESLTRNPTHTYQSSGTYDVTLKIYSSSGDSASRTYTVTVNPGPLAFFSVDPVCLGETSICKNKSIIVNTEVDEWKWDFGNGNFSTTQGDAIQSYVKTDTVTLSIRTTNGCADSVSHEAVVADIPSANIMLKPGDETVFCEGDSSELIALDYNPEFEYIWMRYNFPDKRNSQNYYVKSTGEYSLWVISNVKAGCVDSTMKIRFIKYPNALKPEIVISGKTDLCPDDIVTLKVDTTKYDPIYNRACSYNWLRYGQKTGNESISISGYLNVGEYSVESSFKEQCQDTSDWVEITHIPAPDKPVLFVNAGPYLYYMSCSNLNADSYMWYFNGNLIPEAHKYYYPAGTKTGRYYVVIKEDYSDCYVRSDEIEIPGGFVGINNIFSENDIRIYPNPNNGSFKLILPKILTDVQKIEIFNVTGTLVFQKKIQYMDDDIDIQSNIHVKGIYLIKIYTKSEKYILKMNVF